MTPPSPEPTDDDLKAPEGLVQALCELQRQRIFVPEAVDSAILRRAGRRSGRRPVIWLAAAATFLLAAWLGWMQVQPRAARYDVNRDGRVDIIDALVLGRWIAEGKVTGEWDLNRDGRIDQSDAEIVARQAVKLSNGGAS